MLKITGGVFRGRVIQTPSHLKTRPSQAKLRQALFNSLQAYISEARVLDLFAGSGSLGLEALSRGASQVTFVEMGKSAIRVIEKNCELLQVQKQTHILESPIDSVLSQLKKRAPFDLILADPPYEEGWEMKLLESWPWQELLSPEGFFCLEWGAQKSTIAELPDQISNLVKVREKNYGDSVLTTFRRANHQEEEATQPENQSEGL